MSRQTDRSTPEQLCNCGTLRKATRRISLLYDEVLEPSGLKLSQYQVLSHIERAGTAPSMKELAAALILNASALAHNMKPLERDGYVSQVRDETDGRSRRVTLTPLGRTKFLECKRLWSRAQRRFELAYGQQRSQSLVSALSELLSDNFTRDFLIARAR